MLIGHYGLLRSQLSREAYSALEQVSLGVTMSPYRANHLINPGLIVKALGGLTLTAKDGFGIDKYGAD